MLQHRPPNTTALQLTWQYMLQNCMPNRIEILYGLMLEHCICFMHKETIMKKHCVQTASAVTLVCMLLKTQYMFQNCVGGPGSIKELTSCFSIAHKIFVACACLWPCFRLSAVSHVMNTSGGGGCRVRRGCRASAWRGLKLITWELGPASRRRPRADP